MTEWLEEIVHGGSIIGWAIVRAFANDWPAAVQAVVVVVAAVFAGAQLGHARQLREDQSRPFVVVDFDVERRRPMVYLSIKNLGKTMARDVRIAFDPSPKTSWEQEAPASKIPGLKMFREGIPSLAPNKEVRLFYDSAIDLYKDDSLPKTFDVTISYKGDLGAKTRIYSDRTLLDLDMYKDVMDTHLKTVHDVAKQLEEIRQELGKLARFAGSSPTQSLVDALAAGGIKPSARTRAAETGASDKGDEEQ